MSEDTWEELERSKGVDSRTSGGVMTKVKVEPKEIVYAIACAVGLKGQTIPCKGCGRELYFFPTVKGKRNPIDALTGIPHWGNCPNAEEFRTKRIDG